MDLVEKTEGSPQAPVVVLFGGSPYRRHEVIKQIAQLGDVTVYGTLSEQEGIAKIEELDRKVDIVLIGGRYDTDQRQRIKHWLEKNLPKANLSQPGVDFPYSDEAIVNDIKSKLKNANPLK